MACTATARPGDRLEEIDTELYHLQHICALLEAFAGQQGPRNFTDGLSLEMFAVVFGWIITQMAGARSSLEEVQKELRHA